MHDKTGTNFSNSVEFAKLQLFCLVHNNDNMVDLQVCFLYMSMVFVSSCFWLHHKLLGVQQLMHGAFLDNL